MSTTSSSTSGPGSAATPSSGRPRRRQPSRRRKIIKQIWPTAFFVVFAWLLSLANNYGVLNPWSSLGWIGAAVVVFAIAAFNNPTAGFLAGVLVLVLAALTFGFSPDITVDGGPITWAIVLGIAALVGTGIWAIVKVVNHKTAQNQWP